MSFLAFGNLMKSLHSFLINIFLYMEIYRRSSLRYTDIQRLCIGAKQKETEITFNDFRCGISEVKWGAKFPTGTIRNNTMKQLKVTCLSC